MIAHTTIAHVPGRRIIEALADTLILVGRRAREVAGQIGRSLRHHHQVNRNTRLLRDMPDYLLRDIGLTRTDLMRATVRRVHEEEAIRRGPHW
jgi:uncharacterized protein YjiS (DUF1127 family)